MHSDRRSSRLAAAGVAAALLAAACSSTPAPTPPAAASPGTIPEGLVQAAKAEGGLTTIALPRSWCNYGAVIDGFTARYGIPVNGLNPDGSSQQALEAITANKGSKGPAAPDVIDVGPSDGSKAMSEGLIAPYKVSTWADIPNSAKDPSGYWYGDYYGVMAFEVNTSVIRTVPRDWSDLLAAGKGTVALAGAPTGSNQAVSAVWAAALANGGSLDNAQPGLDYFKQLNRCRHLRPRHREDGHRRLGPDAHPHRMDVQRPR